MSMMKHWSWGLGLAAFVACHHPITQMTEDDPGFVILSVQSSYTNAGAIRLVLRGPAIDSVESSLTIFGSAESGGTYRAIVVGSVGTGSIARFWVPNRNDLDDYTVDVVEAASVGSYAQLDPGGYFVSLVSGSD